MSSSPSELDALEQQWLKQLDETNQTCMTRLNAVRPPNRAATPNELGAGVVYLGQIETYFEGYTATAVYLKNSGRSRLFDRLQLLLADIRQAKSKTMEMYKRALAGPPPAPPQVPQNDWSGIQDAMARQKAAFERQFAGWQSGFNQACLHCQNPLGEAYYWLAICPRCGRFPRG